MGLTALTIALLSSAVHYYLPSLTGAEIYAETYH